MNSRRFVNQTYMITVRNVCKNMRPTMALNPKRSIATSRCNMEKDVLTDDERIMKVYSRTVIASTFAGGPIFMYLSEDNDPGEFLLGSFWGCFLGVLSPIVVPLGITYAITSRMMGRNKRYD